MRVKIGNVAVVLLWVLLLLPGAAPVLAAPANERPEVQPGIFYIDINRITERT